MTALRISSIIILATVFISSFFYGDAIVCYQCNSAFDPRCGDPFDPYSLGTVNCSFQERLEHLNHMEPTLCRKISQKVYGKMRVIRGCGYITDELRDNAACARKPGTHDVMAYHCSCTTDLCNAATGLKPSFIGFLLGFVGLFVTWLTR